MKHSSTDSKTLKSKALGRKPLKKVSAKKKKKTIPVKLYAAILKDHREFRGQMKAIMKLADAAKFADAKTAYAQFKIHLHAHAEGEEKSLYTTLLGKSAPGEKLADQVLEGKEEHHVADLLLNELTQIQATDARWKAKFRVLMESVEHHLEEEEEYLKSWKKHLDHEEVSRVYDRFLHVKHSIMREQGFGFAAPSMTEGLYARH